MSATKQLLIKLNNISPEKRLLCQKEDYDCHYGEHSCGPFIDLFDSGKAKLLQAGLTEEEIKFLESLDCEMKDLIIICNRVGPVLEKVTQEYNGKLAQWRKERQWDHFINSCTFLEGLLDESLRDIFVD